jgi:hypothetical protein
VPTLSDAPNRATDLESVYDDKADQFASEWIDIPPSQNTLSGQVNVIAVEINANASASFTNATESAASAALSQSSANFVGLWSNQTGAANIPYSVEHNDANWQLTNNLADVTLSEPGVTSDWSETGQHMKTQVFTSSGNFTVPAGVTVLKLSGCAAGGGGGGGRDISSANVPGASGGGSGESCIDHEVVVTPGDVIAVTIGAFGTGGVSADGTPGGSVSFGSLLTLEGGTNGISTTSPSARLFGGDGGGPYAGSTSITADSGNADDNGDFIGGGSGGFGGQAVADQGKGGPCGNNDGGAVIASTGNTNAAGSGGSSYFGIGGSSGTNAIDGLPGNDFGSGGGGGATDETAGGAFGDGGDGAPGFLRMEWL